MNVAKHPSRPSKKSIVPVILAGGAGSRLWPLSREAHPKPFIKLGDGQSLIQKAYLRAIGIEGVGEIVTVTNRELFFHAKDEYEKASSNDVRHSFMLEPFGRNSSAAIALAAHYAQETHGDDCILLVLPADHLIDNQEAFVSAAQQAAAFAAQGKLVTFGVKPDSPKTGYGYIEANGHNVKRFVEKPDIETARRYLSSGNYYWNSGMFCMSAGAILAEMRDLCPDIVADSLSSFKSADRLEGTGCSQIEIDARSFEDVRSISIDYAVFEKSDKVIVIPCDIGWSDIGTWIEFGMQLPGDEANNHVFGDADLEDVANCIVYGESRLVAGLGLEDLVIADTADALLVAHKDHAQDVRKIVDRLKESGNPGYRFFPTVYRPWGSYTVLLYGAGFKLKRIDVKPGAALSLQSHRHRNEHWVVVDGIAKVTNGDETLRLGYNQSTYIPVGNRHRLENPGNETLTLIEVQCGNYLGEDDIVRYEDAYNRR